MALCFVRFYHVIQSTGSNVVSGMFAALYALRWRPEVCSTAGGSVHEGLWTDIPDHMYLRFIAAAVSKCITRQRSTLCPSPHCRHLLTRSTLFAHP